MNNLKKNNQSISRLTGQLIRHYQMPVSSGKKETLHTILQKIDRQEQKNNKPVPGITWFIKAGASVAAVAAILIVLYFFTASVNISSGDKEISAYRLPDSSRVVLQKNSQIKFNKYFRVRNVALDGEAYFEVNKGHDFRVKTNLGHVEVIGTRFLVSADDNEFNVKCFHGRLKTQYNKSAWILDEGTQFSGNKKNVKKEKLGTKMSYPDFAMFKGSFSNERLTKVINQLETFFGVEIEIREGAMKNFSGTLQTGNLESALQIVCGSLQLKYRFVNKHKVIVTNN